VLDRKASRLMLELSQSSSRTKLRPQVWQHCCSIARGPLARAQRNISHQPVDDDEVFYYRSKMIYQTKSYKFRMRYSMFRI
jgi:hypothetical protein